MAAEDDTTGDGSLSSSTSNNRDSNSQITTTDRPNAARNNNNNSATPNNNESSNSFLAAAAAEARSHQLQQQGATATDSSMSNDATDSNMSSDAVTAPAAVTADVVLLADSTTQSPASAAPTAAAAAPPDSSSAAAAPDSSAAAAPDSSAAATAAAATGADAVNSKLLQVQGYIQQTVGAMTALEQQADMGKIGQYNTLVKVLRELKTSEVKLMAHLARLRAVGSDESDQQNLPNSQSIGLVSSRTVDAVDGGLYTRPTRTPTTLTNPPPPRNSAPVIPTATDGDATNTTAAPPPPPSFADRLSAGMAEATQITDRLRENVARREDLVERYRATRERLNALKRQRREIQQRERGVLLAQTSAVTESSRGTPYEDPIPGANSWDLQQLNAGLSDFRALYAKVDVLRSAYVAKQQEEGSNVASKAEIANKMQQLEGKRAQLIAVIMRLKQLRANKLREQGMDADLEEDDFEIERRNDRATADAAVGSGSSAIPNTASATAADSLLTAVSGCIAQQQSAVSDIVAAGAALQQLQPSAATADTTLPVETSNTTLRTSNAATNVTDDILSDISDLLPSDPVITGGSHSIGRVSSLVTSMDTTDESRVRGGLMESPVDAVLSARAEVLAAGQELQLRTQHLNNLREELASMKRLLDVTQQRANVTAGGDGAGTAAGEQAQAAVTAEASDDVSAAAAAPVDSSAAAADDPSSVTVTDNSSSSAAALSVTGRAGNAIELTVGEQQDPAVVAKFKRLYEAKQRMAEMEEIMQVISTAHGSGIRLNSILSQRQLQLLQQAEAEDVETQQRTTSSNSHRRERSISSSDDTIRESSIERELFLPALRENCPHPRSSSSDRERNVTTTSLSNDVTASTAVHGGHRADSSIRNNDLQSLSSSSSSNTNIRSAATSAATTSAAATISAVTTSATSAVAAMEATVISDRYEKSTNNSRSVVASDQFDSSMKLSAMERRLAKQRDSGDLVNEEPWHRYNKEDLDKQESWDNRSLSTTELLAQRHIRAAAREDNTGSDPRVTAIYTLQEELRQKKNALEALMRGMGKPSSLHPDNLSDNLSDNISDGESGANTPTLTRHALARRAERDQISNHQQPHHHNQSSLTSDARTRGCAPMSNATGERVVSSGQQPAPSYLLSRAMEDSNRAMVSVNNLSSFAGGNLTAGAAAASSVNTLGASGAGVSPMSVRPKFNNRYSSDRTEEGVPSRSTASQQTISDALQQLSSMQGSINSLYDALKTEQQDRATPPPSVTAPNRQQERLQQQQQQQQQQQIMNNMITAAANNQPSVSGMNNPGQSSSSNTAAANAPLMNTLQQCFSQLYMHSLEIQALNKHIQVSNQQMQQQSLQQPLLYQQQQVHHLPYHHHLQQQQFHPQLMPTGQYNTFTPLHPFNPSFHNLPLVPYNAAVATATAGSVNPFNYGPPSTMANFMPVIPTPNVGGVTANILAGGVGNGYIGDGYMGVGGLGGYGSVGVGGSFTGPNRGFVGNAGTNVFGSAATIGSGLVPNTGLAPANPPLDVSAFVQQQPSASFTPRPPPY